MGIVGDSASGQPPAQRQQTNLSPEALKRLQEIASEIESPERFSEWLRPMLRRPEEAQKIVARVVAISESFSGPMPHPKHLKAYEEIQPGSAKEILEMAQIEQTHRHGMQRLEMLYPYWGLAAGFVGLLACVGGAVALGLYGHEVVAGGMMGVPALGVIGWFVKSRISDDNTQVAKPTPKPKQARRKH